MVTILWSLYRQSKCCLDDVMIFGKLELRGAYADYFGTVPEQTLYNLIKFYEHDYKAFNYEVGFDARLT